jgi:hypothetical protein
VRHAADQRGIPVSRLIRDALSREIAMPAHPVRGAGASEPRAGGA